MKILITGGLGFIGTNLIRYWLNRYPQDSLINLDKITYAANPKNLADITSPNYRFVQGDICDAQTVDSLVGEVEAIIHLAAESHVDRALQNPQVFLDTNIIGTFNLLQSARSHGLRRFHHVSTDEVYGALSLDNPAKFSEDSKFDPRSPYSASKAASDHLVMSFFYSFNLPVTITNCSNNYGPYQSPEKFIPRVITNILTGLKVPLYGDGLYVRDWLYVDDHCAAIDTVFHQGQIGQTYNVGAQHEDINNLTLTRTILRQMGRPEDDYQTVADRPGHDRRYAVDWTKINRDLGWSPQTSFDQGITRTIKWYTDNQDWWQAAKKEAEEFYRLAATK